MTDYLAPMEAACTECGCTGRPRALVPHLCVECWTRLKRLEDWIADRVLEEDDIRAEYRTKKP